MVALCHYGLVTEAWTLAGMVKESNGEITVKEIRAVGDDEQASVVASLDRLKRFSGHSLMGALTDARNDLMRHLYTDADDASVALSTAEFRSKFGAKLSHWLTTFTGFRRQMENLIALVNVPWLTAVQENFETVYRKHPEYRLTWQLRNLDQHDPPASAAVSFRSASDRPGLMAVIDLPRLFTDRTANNDRDSAQWRACQALWAGQEIVEFAQVVHLAYLACETIMGAAVHDVELRLIEDIGRLTKLYAEVVGSGAPCLIRTEPIVVPKGMNMQLLQIDLLAIGEAIVTVNGARRILGQPEIDVKTDPRFGPDLSAYFS